MIITGYLFNYTKSIITSTASGRPDPPDWPDFGDWKDDILMPYLQLFGLLALAFGPALIIAVWRPGTETQVRIAHSLAHPGAIFAWVGFQFSLFIPGHGRNAYAGPALPHAPG